MVRAFQAISIVKKGRMVNMRPLNYAIETRI